MNIKNLIQKNNLMKLHSSHYQRDENRIDYFATRLRFCDSGA